MCRLMCAFALSVAAVSSPAQSDDTPAIDALQGNWEMKSFSHFGTDNKEQRALLNLLQGREPNAEGNTFVVVTLEVKGEAFRLSHKKDLTRQATVKLDGEKKPKSIDLKDGDGKPYLGVYKLEGDNLTISVGDQKARPTDFDTEKPGQVVAVFKRVK